MKLTENNKVLKLVALLIAIVLWLYVGTQQDPLAQHTYEVTVEVQNLSVDKTATLGQETVQVRVMGRQDRLNALRGSDFKAYVDLSDVTEGENEVPVKVELPSEVYFARIEPQTVDVLVSDREGSNMDVDIVTTGTLPEGITIEDMSVSPKTVFVTGDPDDLERVDKVGVAVDLSNIFDNSKADTELVFYDVGGNVIDDADLEALPGSVVLTIKVSQSDIEKDVPIQANLVGQMPNGVQIDSVDISPETATVSGSPEKLADIGNVETEAIDISKITETTQLTVKLVGDAVSAPKQVTVTINVSSTQDTGSSGQSYIKVVPISLSGAGASNVSIDTQMVEVSYHMESGYADAGATLNAYVYIPDAISEATTAQVQLSHVEGLVVDAITPSTVTVYPNNVYE
ncbi:MAG: CdaR family protein [Peptococcaceae bacterium]|nr:CdaR family protein [Peptococcaceae bacterium]